MNSKAIPAIAISVVGVAVVAAAFVFGGACDPGEDPDCPTQTSHDVVRSGPLSVTQYDHRLGENVYFLIRGLQPDERGNIGVFTPQNILYKTIPYDGSQKSSFNQFFFLDTSKTLGVCTPEDLVGIWRVVFEDGSYPPLEFRMTDEYIIDGEKNLQIVC